MKRLLQLAADSCYSGFGHRHFLKHPLESDCRPQFRHRIAELGIILKITLLQRNIAIRQHLDMEVAAKIVPCLIKQRNTEIRIKSNCI